MSTNVLIVSKDSFFLIGLESMLNNAVIFTGRKRIVIIDARLEYVDFNYTPQENDRVFYITSEPYESALENLFYDYFRHGQFITTTSDMNFLKKMIITQNVNRANASSCLTNAEKLIICTLASAGTYYKCAKRLSISCKTVSHHKISVMNKLGLRTLNHLLIIPKFFAS